jgi:hypothetical protein
VARTQPSLARLRQLRVPRERDAALAADIERLRAELIRRRRAGVGTAGAWACTVPPELAEKSTVIGVFRGVMKVRARDAATRFALDRYLRSGGEAAVIRASPIAVKRVRLVM